MRWRRISGLSTNAINAQQHSTSSRYFEIRGRLRLDDAIIEETSTVVAQRHRVRVLSAATHRPVPGHAGHRPIVATGSQSSGIVRMTCGSGT